MAHKLKIGITDKENPGCAYIDDFYQFIDNNNSLVCGTLEWEFLDTSPACVGYLNLLKTILGQLHICIITPTVDNDIEGVNYSTNIRIDNLFPETHTTVPYQDEDYLAFTNKFNNPGDLYVDTEHSAALADVNYLTTYDYATKNEDFSWLSKNHSYNISPCIEFDLNLQPQNPHHLYRWEKRMESLKKKNEARILEAGFELNDPKLTPGELKIAKLLTDHETAFNLIEKYPNICSIEIVEE